MTSRPFLALLAVALAAGACATTRLEAQATSSPGHVALQNEASNGRRSQSTTFVLDGAFGRGVTARGSSSKTYVLLGGFPSTLDVPTTGRPWLTGVQPRYATMRGQATLTLRGTEMDLGTFPTVLIGGQRATALTRSPDAITTRLPIQPEPGWLPVEVQNSHGTTILPRGVGVLPLVEADPAAASDRPFELVFRGTKGDQVLWAMGIGQGSPIRVKGLHFGFAILPPTFIVFSGFGIADPGGNLRLRIGAQTYPVGLVYVQGLFLSTNPGYAPGAFSNVLNL